MAEFAPLYSKAERIRLVLRALAIMVPLFLLSKFWFFPWLNRYASFSNCHDYGDFTGTHVVMYAVFVLIPLSSALLFWLLLGRRGLRVWRAGQSPLPGEKTLKKVRYRHGMAARIETIMVFLFIACFIGLSIWGSFQAGKITRNIAPCSEAQLQQMLNPPDGEDKP